MKTVTFVILMLLFLTTIACAVMYFAYKSDIKKFEQEEI